MFVVVLVQLFFNYYCCCLQKQKGKDRYLQSVNAALHRSICQTAQKMQSLADTGY